jgi:RNA polymerase sigma-70 factor (ECF subfamily)
MSQLTDTQKFDRLYRDYRSRFVRFAATYVYDRAAAEEIVTDSLMYYWEHRRELRNERNIPAYILNVVKHMCINWLQHEQVRRAAATSLREQENWELELRLTTLDACNPERLFSDEIQRIIDRTLSGVSKQSREIFLYSKYGRKSNREIAGMLQLSVKSVEYHITKVLKQLRIALKDYLMLILLFI